MVILVGCGLLGEKYVRVEWYATYFEKYYVRWIDDFEKAHSDSKVRIIFRAIPGSGPQKVYTMLISNTLCDVIDVKTAAYLLLHYPVLEPVGPEDLDRTDFVPLSIKQASRPDGTLVGYPGGIDMRGFVYYNRDHIREAGLEAVPVPETFDAYREWAGRTAQWQVGDKTILGTPSPGELKTASLRRRPIGMTRGFVWSSFPFILAYMDPVPDEGGKSDGSIDDYIGGPPSGRPWRFDSKEFAQGLEEYRDFFLPKQTAVADGDTSRLNGFMKGIYSGMEGGNWIYGETPSIDLFVTKFPHAEGRPMRTWSGGGSWGVSATSKHKDLAIEWTKYISSTERQVDAYYGHGYLPARLSAWRRLSEDAQTDKEVRKRFLGGFTGESAGYVGLPQVKRQYHDAMDVVLNVPLSADRTILKLAPGQEVVPAEGTAMKGEELPAEAVDSGAPARPQEDLISLKSGYEGAARRLQAEIAAFTGQKVTLIVQGTPPEMVASRSFVVESPIEVYAPVLEGSCVWIWDDILWTRICNEVITRALQFVSRDDDPLTPEEAAEWAQKEAEDIEAGRK